MTYKDLAKTFEMLAKHKPDVSVLDWVSYDSVGIDLSNFKLSSSEIRLLAELGWSLGNDNEYDEEEIAAWFEPDKHTDDELVKLFKKYKSIYKYADILQS